MYNGHGGYSEWMWPISPFPYTMSYSSLGQYGYNLRNRLPFIISSACLTGGFHAQDDCMAEQFQSYGINNGSIGYIGSSEILQASANYSFFPYCFEALDADLTTCGEMLMLAKLKTNSQEFRNKVNLFGDPALNIMLDSDEIQLCDLVCSPMGVSEPVNMNNQTLVVTAGVQNLSDVSVTNVNVQCTITNEYMNEDMVELTTIDIAGLETGSAVFNFDINTLYPADLVIEIFADPNNLIEERSENNNSATKSYKFFREQINFPVYINDEAINGNMPLWFDDSIIVSGKKFDNTGNPIWNWNTINESKSLFVPIYDVVEDCYNFVVIIHSEGSGDGIALVNGQNGSYIDDYILPVDYEISNICVDDLTNDGNYEIVISSTTGDNSCITILDDELTVMQSIDTISGKIKIAVADGNNNGIKEIFSLDIDAQRLTVYEYDNGNNLFYSIHSRDFNVSVEGLCLMDHYNSGILNCVVYSFDSEFMIILPADNINHPQAQIIELRSALNNIALGDIDNDGDDEIVLLSDVNRIKVIDSGVVNILCSISEEIHRNGALLLYDLDYNNLPEMIFYDNNEIYAYYQNGDSIFKFPVISTSTPIIFDIDMDGDIEILNLIKPSDDGLTGLNVSDLPNHVSNHGNLYPKMNEFCNNLYSQPVSGQLAANANYYWSGSITLHNEVTLPSNSTLTIIPGTIIKAKENSKLTAYGDVHINGTENQPVKFIPAITGASQDYWQGLEFPEGNTCAELNYMNIENGSITAERNLTIDCGSFINTPLTLNGASLNANNVEFNNSPILAELYGIQAQSEMISISDCNIANLTNDAGIEITGYPSVYLANNTINNCTSGIKIWESGSGVTHSLNDNYITNNAEYGLLIYHSNIDIEGSNLLANNNEGLFVMHDSNFSMIGSEDYPLQNVHDNLRHEVRFTYDSRPSEFYHNKIYDNAHDYSYIKCDDVPLINEPIIISNNNWGTTFNPETDLSPMELFTYLPIWYPGVPDEKESGTDEEIFLTALTAEENSEYEVAEQTYEQVISFYPSSEYSVISAKKLFDLKVKYDQDFYDLKLYYETEPNMQYNDELSSLAEFLITCCNVKLEEFEPAINWFEEIIQNPPTIVDSVFAVIDAGYTYLVMGNSRSSCSGKISGLIPKSKKQFAVKRDELIDLLFGDSEPVNEIPQIFELKLYPNYPNPFNPETMISFSIPEECKVGLDIYNIKGQKVKKLLDCKLEKGLHKVIWNSADETGKHVASGVYFYKFKVNGKDKDVKKMLLLK